MEHRLSTLSDFFSPVVEAITIVGTGVVGYFVHDINGKLRDVKRDLGRKIDELAMDCSKLNEKHSELQTEIARNQFTRQDAERQEQRLVLNIEKNRQEISRTIENLDQKMDKILFSVRPKEH